MLPEVGVIVGAMKAGTSSLFGLLAQHPEICPARWKEPEFFSRPYIWRGTAYPQLWRFNPTVHKCALEASTGYSKSPPPPEWRSLTPAEINVPQQISRYAASSGSKIRLIYVMRDPVERLESHLAHRIARSGMAITNLSSAEVDYALAVSSYAAQLDRYMEEFDRKDILLLNFEDLKRHDTLSSTLKKCCSFLDVSQFAFTLGPPQNTREDMGGPRAILNHQQRQDVRDRLAPDVERLREAYGVDTLRWENFHQEIA